MNLCADVAVIVAAVNSRNKDGRLSMVEVRLHRQGDDRRLPAG
jgi:hypothetical protein